ncbi:MAG: hypothetical protein ACREFZ_12520, partial [Acetobacteraceae bacterium]
MRYVLGLLQAVPALAALIEREQEETIALRNRTVIEVHTASFRVTRGYTLAAVLADEIAFWPAEDSANPDVEIIRAVRPGLATLPHSLLVLASSPYAKRGALYQTYARNFGRDDARVLVWQAPTITMNTAFDPRILEEAREEDPEAAAAEYEAQFRDDVSDYIPRETIDSCTPRGLTEIPPANGISYAAFVDPSGGSADSMTLALAHQEPDGPVVLDAIREARPPFSPEHVVRDFAALLQSYGIARATGDRFGGAWPVELFAKSGIAYEASASSKSELYRELLPLLTAGKVQLLDHTKLAAQLASLERRTSRAGRDSIDHPAGGHDDV